MGGVFLALCGWISWKSTSDHLAIYAGVAGGLGGALVLLGTLAPRSLKQVHRAWMAVAVAMGKVMTPVIMTIFFFTILLPFTLVRLSDPLRRKLGAATYWEPHRNVESTLERFQRPF